MDLQTRKLEFLTEFLTIKSEELTWSLDRILQSTDDAFEPFHN